MVNDSQDQGMSEEEGGGGRKEEGEPGVPGVPIIVLIPQEDRTTNNMNYPSPSTYILMCVCVGTIFHPLQGRYGYCCVHSCCLSFSEYTYICLRMCVSFAAFYFCSYLAALHFSSVLLLCRRAPPYFSFFLLFACKFVYVCLPVCLSAPFFYSFPFTPFLLSSPLSLSLLFSLSHLTLTPKKTKQPSLYVHSHPAFTPHFYTRPPHSSLSLPLPLLILYFSVPFSRLEHSQPTYSSTYTPHSQKLTTRTPKTHSHRTRLTTFATHTNKQDRL